MKIRCDKCQTKYSIADEKVRGKVFKIKCKRCTNIIVVRGTDSATPEPSASFDQNETRVFDYGAGGSPEEAAAGVAAPGGAAWYLVIDREQVGPLSPTDVSDKWARAEVDADTYAWREGRADWLRLGDIDEFKFLTAEGAAGAASGEMGGSDNPFAQAGTEASQSDPADLFAASAPADEGPADLFGGGGDGAAAGADLFGGGAAAAPAQGADLFAAAPAAGFNGNGAAPDAGGQSPRVEVDAGMTGQRNENSVLFSLSNLAQLAADAPKASAPAPAFASTGGTEGSGLIDIRAMAAMTLGGGGPGAGAATADDDLPMFSPAGFGAAPAGGMLLPSAAPEARSNKGMMIMVAVLLAAVLGLAAFVVLGGRGDAPGTVADNSGGATGTGGALGTAAGADDKDSDKKPGDDPVKSATNDDKDDDDDDDSADNDGNKEPVVKAPVNKVKGSKGSRNSSRGRGSKVRGSKDKGSRRDPKPAPPPKPPKRGSSAKCDQIECLVDPSRACCRKGGGGGSRGGGGGSSANLPDKPTKAQVISAFKRVSGRVGSCGDRYNSSGVIHVKVKVGGNGKIKSATAVGKFAGTPTGKCVEKAVRRAKFPKTKRGTGFKYPFRL